MSVLGYAPKLMSSVVTSAGYTRTLTIDHTKCGSSDSSNFPVLVYASDTSLKTTANGGHVQRSDGNDILFYSDAGLTTLLNWEIDMYDGTNGILYAWVSLPTVKGSTSGIDTVFYMKYGDSSITTFHGGSTGAVWTNDGTYQLVNHFGDGVTLSISDSTTNNVAALNSTAGSLGGIAGAGKIGGSIKFDYTTSGYLKYTTDMPINSVSKVTISGWVNVGAFVTDARMLFSKWPSGQYNNDLIFSPQWTGTTFLGQVDNGADGGYSYTSGDIHGSWHYVQQVFDGTATGDANRLKVYIDGSSVSLTFDGGWSVPSTTGPMTGAEQDLGRYANGSCYWDGYIDEFRISTSAKSADWILTEYNNQNNPGNIGTGNFITFSNEY